MCILCLIRIYIILLGIISGPRAESGRVLRPARRISSSERSGEVYRGSRYI